jgi:micrococcal nuclease
MNIECPSNNKGWRIDGFEKKTRSALLRQFGFFAACILGLVCLCAASSPANELTGRVVGIQDGDTLTVWVDNGAATRIRLWGIDAPEKRQAYSNASKKYLSNLAYGKRVRLIVRDIDQYGRTVAEVILPDERNANQEMVRAGYAWWYRKYAPNDRVLGDLENKACRAKRGLWADPQAVPPWEYRRIRRSR